MIEIVSTSETGGAGPPILEEQLCAYVDGRLDAEQRSRVDRYLRVSPDLAERIANYRVQRDLLRAAFSVFGREPIPPRLNLSLLVESRLAQLSRPWRVTVPVALAFGWGWIIGWWLGRRPPPRSVHWAKGVQPSRGAGVLPYSRILKPQGITLDPPRLKRPVLLRSRCAVALPRPRTDALGPSGG